MAWPDFGDPNPERGIQPSASLTGGDAKTSIGRRAGRGRKIHRCNIRWRTHRRHKTAHQGQKFGQCAAGCFILNHHNGAAQRAHKPAHSLLLRLRWRRKPQFKPYIIRNTRRRAQIIFAAAWLTRDQHLIAGAFGVAKHNMRGDHARR